MEKNSSSPSEIGMIDAAFENFKTYLVAPVPAKLAYKHYQLALLQLLALYSPIRKNRLYYGVLAARMKKFKFLPSIVSRPAQFELYIVGRKFLLSRILRKNGFRWIPELRCWYFSPVNK
jgi:hypothetical protein